MQQLIIQSAMLIAYLIIFIYQFHSIKTLKEKLMVLEKFQSIFDVKKIEEYVKVIEQKAAVDVEMHKRAQINQYMKDEVEKAARAQGSVIFDRYAEITNVVADVFLEQSHQDNAVIFDLLPLNKEFLERVMAEKRKTL